MTQIPQDEISTVKAVNYLPHHAVFKEGSTTTKLRVVFDGSAKTSSGLSFNDVQRVGPVVQNDLLSITLRFRQYSVVLSADIAQMYRQIRVADHQQDLQRVLWRTESTKPIQHFRLSAVTYGTASAPFLATRALRQIGKENKENYPTASQVIIRDFYVDDLLTGTDTVEEAKELKGELTQLLSDAGMELRKWASNDPSVLNDSNYSTSEKTIQTEKDPKTLGLLWDPRTDTLRYSLKEAPYAKITKLTILSRIAQIFDPLGLVGPAVIKAKILLQRLWQLQIDWDESLPQNLHSEWEYFSTHLMALNKISVERRVINDRPDFVQLHGFSDASE
ncbi:uncharacterized protein LOC117182582, partial [Belonocnema kinseyi]|uniref:uncharacterized protein LOC117182582 n=1 Tax=Belonocnema kinseyi TaxID=2817044 RepID=UPI00143D6500